MHNQMAIKGGAGDHLHTVQSSEWLETRHLLKGSTWLECSDVRLFRSLTYSYAMH
jgi:hypothetical protein